MCRQNQTATERNEEPQPSLRGYRQPPRLAHPQGGRWQKIVKTKEQRAQEIMAAIGSVLFNDWDFLNLNDCAPPDEYDSYIGKVYRIMTRTLPLDEMIVELHKFEGQELDLTEQDRQRLENIVRKLMEIDLTLPE